jgi:hypothetical protein
MLRKYVQKLPLRTETIRVLTRLQATRVQGGKTVPTAFPCTSTDNPTLVLCDATDGCQVEA